MRRLAIAALAVGLAGCGLSLGPGASTYRGVPRSGQCWSASQAEAAKWMAWEGSAPVSCSQQHTLETVGVFPVDGDYALAEGKTYPGEYLDLAGDLCEPAWKRATSWAEQPNRLSTFLFYPGTKAFAGGQHWVRCDVGLTATGTAWVPDEYQLEVLTQSLADLRAAAKDDANLVALCLDSKSDEIGDTGEQLTIADCNEDHRWSMVRATDLATNDDEKYPGDPEVQRRGSESCLDGKPDAVKGWFWLAPTKSEWLNGMHISYCFWSAVPTTSA